MKMYPFSDKYPVINLVNKKSTLYWVINDSIINYFQHLSVYDLTPPTHDFTGNPRRIRGFWIGGKQDYYIYNFPVTYDENFDSYIVNPYELGWFIPEYDRISDTLLSFLGSLNRNKNHEIDCFPAKYKLIFEENMSEKYGYLTKIEFLDDDEQTNLFIDSKHLDLVVKVSIAFKMVLRQFW